jgi:hypothetical protein
MAYLLHFNRKYEKKALNKNKQQNIWPLFGIFINNAYLCRQKHATLAPKKQ